MNGGRWNSITRKAAHAEVRPALRPLNLCELAAVSDGDGGAGAAAVGTDSFDSLDHIHTLGDGAEHDVLAVEPSARDGGPEELRTVGARAGVGQGEETGAVVLEAAKRRK